MSRKTPQGEGYTVRKDGRKVLKTKMLESEVEELKRNYEELQRQNDALRAKQNLQLTLLDNYEVWLRRLNGLTADVPLTLPCPSASTGDSSSMTAQLEERIQHLKQHLVLPLAAATPPISAKSSSSQASAAAACSVPDATSGAAAAVDAARAAAAAAGCSGNDDQGNNMARWFQSVTPEDVAAMQGFTVESIAIRIRDVTRQLAVAHWGTVFEGSAQAAQAEYDLQEEMAKISITATISNEDVFVKVYGLNMETLQYEAPPPGHWMDVAKAINLTPAQTEAICRAYQDVSDMQAAAMKRQAGIVQELQAILGGTGPTSRSTSAAVAAAISDNVAAGPAQFMSLATGAPVSTEPAVADGLLLDPTAAQAGMDRMASLGPDSLAAVATAWEAVSPLSEDRRSFLSHFCLDGASHGAGQNGTTNSSLHSSSSSWLAPAGVLTLQDAERVKVLLEELVRVDMSVKSHTQGLAVAFTNITTTTQRAATLLASYPWFLVTPEICASVVQLDAEAKQKGTGRAA